MGYLVTGSAFSSRSFQSAALARGTKTGAHLGHNQRQRDATRRSLTETPVGLRSGTERDRVRRRGSRSTAKPLFVGSIPTGASLHRNDLRASARKLGHITVS